MYGKVLSFLIRHLSNYYTLHRCDLAARAAPLDPRLVKAQLLPEKKQRQRKRKERYFQLNSHVTNFRFARQIQSAMKVAKLQLYEMLNVLYPQACTPDQNLSC